LYLRFEEEVHKGQKGRQSRERPANPAAVKTLKSSLRSQRGRKSEAQYGGEAHEGIRCASNGPA